MIGNIYITGGANWQMADVAESASAEIFTLNNVGIGTINPATKLDIIFDSDSGIKFDSVSSAAGTLITSYQGTTNSNVRQLVFDVQNFVVNTGAPQGTTTTERLRITSDGLVGIGTDNPSGILHVKVNDSTTYDASGTGAAQQYGGATLSLQNTDSTANNYCSINFLTKQTATGGSRIVSLNSGNNESTLTFITESSGTPGERVRITSDGKVGIGTDTPGAILEVFDATSNTILNVKSGDSGAVLNLIDDSARSSIEQNGTTLKISSDTGAEDADSDIRLQVDGSSKMIIRDGGDVVTGVPAHDNQNNTGSRTVFTVADTTNGALLHIRGQSPAIFFDQSGGNIGKVFLDSVDFAIQSGTPASEGTERVRIESDGRVGINTNSELRGQFNIFEGTDFNIGSQGGLDNIYLSSDATPGNDVKGASIAWSRPGYRDRRAAVSICSNNFR